MQKCRYKEMHEIFLKAWEVQLGLGGMVGDGTREVVPESIKFLKCHVLGLQNYNKYATQTKLKPKIMQ